MVLKPITRRLVPDDVFEQLLEEVVDGSLGPGDALPSERRLAELLGVSRPAVREALQRMSATRLVEVRHGGATTVRDFQRHAGLDLLPRLLVRTVSWTPTPHAASSRPGTPSPRRRRDGCRACRPARRDRPGTLSPQRVAAIAAAEDPESRQRAALAFWDAVVDLADSIVFRLMFNSLRAAYEPAIEALAPLLESEVGNLDGYRAVAAAVLGGDPDAAAEAAMTLLRPATEAMVHFLEDFEEPNEGEDA